MLLQLLLQYWLQLLLRCSGFAHTLQGQYREHARTTTTTNNNNRQA
jgi:hypothetical protein